MIVGSVTVPCSQVMTSRLAELARVFAQVEDIIDDLECHSNVGSVLPQVTEPRLQEHSR